MFFNYYIPTKILFGKGQLSNLHKEKLPGKKALIVISSGNSIKKYGYLDKLLDQLTKANVASVLYDKILPNPIKEHVMEGAAIAKENACDFVIGLGGGSSIDTAKAIAVMATNEGDYWDYISGGTGKGLPVPFAPLPIVAITTTAGTGTEADPWTVITKSDTNEKIGFGYEKTFPVLSVVDPELMMTVPAHLTAYQGFDALFHSTEGYINKTAYVLSDLYALKAIELIGKSLAEAVNNGGNSEARAHVALANTLAGMVESTSGCTSEHSLEHALSAYHPELPHGAGLIMISKAYYTYIANSGTCDERMIDMAKALGKTDATCPMDFVTALVDLQKACHVDELKMSDYGITYDEMDKLATNAREAMGGLFEVDPVPISHEACITILEASYK
ncbi:alcohol dehydrogenase [Sporanaerobium hydrogeniformans]|uniref:Alcohol dehydrogenase n=1 Tax=Sporanaerobium hydrogeniformans TaxID=3072179 RepID=A0AC61DAE8_9FIRM|nr:iron-containing alcohol dehydrogenase [Sporanaerobium hydrogeniformans]PHV70264.1 alcohol dehydrogenase [Sporanaerobium hydrogeniformans]